MKKLIFIPALLLMILQSCKSLNNTQKATGIGAATGAAAGGIIAGKNNTALGAILGAVIGGGAGYIIGSDMDKQATEIKGAVPGAEVNRVGEGIELTFNSALLFQINSSELSDSAKASLDKLAGIFTKYPETNILVEGHTDDTGTDEFNMQLSEKRAYAVSNYLEAEGVPQDRFTIKWYGENQPKYPNDSEENRVKNRRVELAIVANKEMKKKAKKNKLQQ
ncbi:MAG: OmpA family protein [Chitinophagaceae bacterium]